jgi:hypothetical protein
MGRSKSRSHPRHLVLGGISLSSHPWLPTLRSGFQSLSPFPVFSQTNSRPKSVHRMRESQATTCHGEQGRSSAIHRFLFSTSTSHLPLYFENTSASSTTVRGSRSPPQTCISSPTIVLHGALHHIASHCIACALRLTLSSSPPQTLWNIRCVVILATSSKRMHGACSAIPCHVTC